MEKVLPIVNVAADDAMVIAEVGANSILWANESLLKQKSPLNWKTD